MSIFSKAWRVLREARRVVSLVADVGSVTLAIFGVKRGTVADKVVDAAKKVDQAADAAEEAAKKK